MVRDSGVLRQAHARAKGFGEAALSALARLPSTPQRRSLAEIAEYVLERRA
jgi:geranylgeranyl pyrophosphate synthase